MALKHLTRYSLTGMALCIGLASGLSVAHAQQEPLVAVHGSVSIPLARINDAATPALTQPLYLTLSLKRTRIAELNAFIASQQDPRSRDYHHWLKPDEVGTRFGASNADVAAVVQYARAQHFNVSVWPNRMFVSVQGTVAQAQNAFRVTLHGYSRPDDADNEVLSPTYFAPDHDPMVPASIAARVDGIYGLSDARQMRPTLKRAKHLMEPLLQEAATEGDIFSKLLPITPPTGGGGLNPTPMFSKPITPSQISKVYNFDGLHALGFTGKGYTIAIFSPTQVADSDIKTFCSTEGLSVPNIVHVKVDGGATNANGSLEACLDAEVILGQAPDVTVYYYESPNNGNLDVWNQIVKDNISVVSDSWAYNETPLQNSNGGPAFIDSFDKIFATMEAQGISHYNSSGDNGTSPNGTLSVDFPGSSPHVTSVGGTSLYGDTNDNYASEKGWAGSGGGLSVHFKQPAWQIGPGVANSSSNGMRQMPDISALADPGTPGYLIYGTNKGATGWYSVGGTSASTPLWAVLNKLTAQRLGNIRTGVLNTSFYGIGNAYGSNPAFCYHDVTSGSNGIYSCTNDWDFVTGWGSANMTKFTADLLQNYWGYAYADLFPYNPGGTWTSPIMIHSDPNNIAEPTTFNSTTSYYFTVAVASNGIADAPGHNNSIQIDGVDNKFKVGPLAVGYYYTIVPLVTTLTPGTHTITLVANADGAIKESNTTNNTFTRTITVANTNPVISGIVLNPTSVTRGQNAVGKVTVTNAAPTGGIVVALTSSDPSATVPTSVTIPAGATAKTFLITTSSSVTGTVSPKISATYAGVTKSATLKIAPITLYYLQLVPPTIEGGLSTVLTIFLTGPAPAGGIKVTLATNDTTDTSIQSSVTIPAGSVGISVPVLTNLVNANATATFNAVVGTTTKNAVLTIIP